MKVELYTKYKKYKYDTAAATHLNTVQSRIIVIRNSCI